MTRALGENKGVDKQRPQRRYHDKKHIIATKRNESGVCITARAKSGMVASADDGTQIHVGGDECLWYARNGIDERITYKDIRYAINKARRKQNGLSAITPLLSGLSGTTLQR